MYRKIAFLLAAVLCMPAYAAQTKNTMKMVSYFPVPYVAYDTVSANNAMDIGVLNQCAMDIKKGTSNLGGSACSLYLYGDPNAADLNSGLLNVAAGKLNLNSNVTNARIVSKKVQIGKDMTTIGGWLDIGLPSGKAKDYDALYISSLKNTGNSFRVTSKENAAKVNNFHMFNEISNDFPGCSGTVTWKELELAADVDKNETYTDVYLVCDGSSEVPPPPDCEAPNGNRYTESCPEGQEGEIVFTWQGEPVCNYKETNNCKDIEEECQPPRGNTYTESCPSGQSGNITYTWDKNTCSYKSVNACVKRYIQRSCASLQVSARFAAEHPFLSGNTRYDCTQIRSGQVQASWTSTPISDNTIIQKLKGSGYYDIHSSGCSFKNSLCSTCEVGKVYFDPQEAVGVNCLSYQNPNTSALYVMPAGVCTEIAASANIPNTGSDCSSWSNGPKVFSMVLN